MIKKYQSNRNRLKNCVVPATEKGFYVESVDLDGAFGTMATSLFSAKNYRKAPCTITAVSGGNVADFGILGSDDEFVYVATKNETTAYQLTIETYDAETLKKVGTMLTEANFSKSGKVIRLAGKYAYSFDTATKVLTQVDVRLGVTVGTVTVPDSFGSQNRWVIVNGYHYFSTSSGIVRVKESDLSVDNLAEGLGATPYLVQYMGHPAYYTAPDYEMKSLIDNSVIGAWSNGAEAQYTTIYGSYTKGDGTYKLIDFTGPGRSASSKFTSCMIGDRSYDIPYDMVTTLSTSFQNIYTVNDKYVFFISSEGLCRVDADADMVSYGKFYAATGGRSSTPTNIVVPPGCALHYKGVIPFVTVNERL